MNNVEEQLKKIVANHLGRNVEELDINNELINDLGGDSLDAVEITLAIEEQFDIKIQDAEYVELKTLQEYADVSNHNYNPFTEREIQVLTDFCNKNGFKIYGFLENLIKEKCQIKTDIYGDPL
jgi:acyl carrier protein